MEGCNMTNPTDWAREAAEEVRKQREHKNLATKKYVAETEQLQREAPAQWNQMREQLKQRIDLLNQELGEKGLQWQSPKSNEAVIGIDGAGAKASLSFNPERYELNCMIGSTVERYTAKVADGKLYFYEGNVGAAWTGDAIVEHILDILIKYM
jgi:hypothetical protein